MQILTTVSPLSALESQPTDIDILFGPISDDAKKDLPEHEMEVEWFETIQLPHAMVAQENVKLGQQKRSGGRQQSILPPAGGSSNSRG
jgi:hypothetical protein